jgi:hypothetical protein
MKLQSVAWHLALQISRSSLTLYRNLISLSLSQRSNLILYWSSVCEVRKSDHWLYTGEKGGKDEGKRTAARAGAVTIPSPGE